MLTQKYSPNSTDEIIGQKKAVESFKGWYESWKPGDKPAFLGGPPGSGKTSLVKALSLEKNLEIIEVNASDKRNAESIKESVGQASKQMSLFMRGKIILIDEVDGLSGNQDRGGVGELRKVLKESKFPIAMTANDPYNPKLREIRLSSLMIPFSKVNSLSVAAYIRRVAEAEGIDIDKDTSRSLAMMAGGDLRSALTDFQVLMSKGSITNEDLIEVGYRERESDIFNLMKIVFKTSTLKTSISQMGSVDRDPDEVFWWLEENIPLEYEKSEEIANAYDWLSRADVMRARAMKTRNFRFKKYMIDIMCGGVSVSKYEKYKKFSRYQGPQRLQRMAQSRGVRGKRKEVCQIMRPYLHASERKIVANYFPLFRIAIENGKGDEIKERFEFVDEDLKVF